MKRYLWINPVALQLYEAGSLDNVLLEKGFTQVQCKLDHIAVVKQKYRQALAKGNGCIVDMRCPMIAAHIRDTYKIPPLIFPDIHPILIHCALELAKSCTNGEDTLTIATPCVALCSYGDKLQLPNTTFLTWNEFVLRNDLQLERRSLSESPIPPGFFSEYGDATQSLRSLHETDAFFARKEYQHTKIVEALYCEQGCHNGDGILLGAT